MIQKYTNIQRVFFLIADLVVLNILYLLPLLLLEKNPRSDLRDLIILNLSSNIIWLLSSYLTAGYEIYRHVNLRLMAKRTATSYFFFAVLVSTLIYLINFKSSYYLAASIVLGFGLTLLVSRLILISYVLYTRSNSNFFKKIIIIGYNETANTLVASFQSSESSLRCLGCFDDIELLSECTNLKYLGKIENSFDFAKENDIAEIYCTLSPEKSPYLYRLAEQAEKEFIRFRFVPDIHRFLSRKVHLDFVGELPVFSLRSEPLNYATAQIKKRFFDVMISSFVIVCLLSWLLPILAIIIKIDSKGPVFFKQLRGGKNNKDFLCIKLRTLKQANTTVGTEVQVKKGDNRLTKVGRILRKTNLDELPQFFNVLMGDMSVVGARPHMLKHDESFASIEERYIIRMLSKPGVTGWAQINGLRGEIKENIQLSKRVEFDIWYIEHWNILLDLKIIWLTVHNMIIGDKNAY